LAEDLQLADFLCSPWVLLQFKGTVLRHLLVAIVFLGNAPPATLISRLKIFRFFRFREDVRKITRINMSNEQRYNILCLYDDYFIRRGFLIFTFSWLPVSRYC
jgi:hypothetical protein